MPFSAVFLDKDGTIVRDVPYNVDPNRMELLPRVWEGLQTLYAAGYRLIIVSNQSGVARGYFPESALKHIQIRLEELLAEFHIHLSGFYYCPHHPNGVVTEYKLQCLCRKPSPGLITDAAEQLDIDLTKSWMIGDILDDVEAGRRAGCRTILINNGNETEWSISPFRIPHWVAGNLVQAAQNILYKDSFDRGDSLPLNVREGGDWL